MRMLGMGVLLSVACTKNESIDTVTGGSGVIDTAVTEPGDRPVRSMWPPSRKHVAATINVDGVTRRFRLTVPTVEARDLRSSLRFMVVAT